MASKLINIRRDIITTLDKIRDEEDISYSEVIERLILSEPEREEVKAYLKQKIEDFF